MEPAGDHQRASLFWALFYRLFAYVAAPEGAPDILTRSRQFALGKPEKVSLRRLCLCHFHTRPQRVRMSEVANGQALTKSAFQTRDGFDRRHECCPRAPVLESCWHGGRVVHRSAALITAARMHRPPLDRSAACWLRNSLAPSSDQLIVDRFRWSCLSHCSQTNQPTK